jgi:DNA processing protein
MTPLEESWLALHLVERIGGKTLRRLLDAFGDVDSVLAAQADAISRRCGLHPELAARVAKAREGSAFRTEKRLVAEHGVRLIPMDSADYPARLGDVYLPPPLLYCKGLWPLPPGPWLAVVGTRGNSRYGERSTRRLVEELAQQEPAAVIVSGLARGIDTVAHEQALACGLHTVAVLGGGLTGIYPPENGELAERIQQRGALLSEFPMTARPLARHFPIRNRVIGGLADAVLVVEAAARSGALITASFALNYGRPVLAVPGNLDQPASEGANRLIQSGQAALVLGGADLLAALRGARHAPAAQLDWLEPQAAPSAQPVPRAAVHEGEKGRILQCLGKGALHPDELARETGLPIERLIGLLLELELSGDIYQTAESHYALA